MVVAMASDRLQLDTAVSMAQSCCGCLDASELHLCLPLRRLGQAEVDERRRCESAVQRLMGSGCPWRRCCFETGSRQASAAAKSGVGDLVIDRAQTGDSDAVRRPG